MTSMSERTLLTLALMLTVTGFVTLSATLGPAARTAPLVVGIPTLALVAVALRRDVTSSRGQDSSDDRQRVVDERRLLGWLTLLVGLTAGAGVPIGVPLWLLLFLRFRSEESWITGIAFSAGLMLALFVIFMVLLRIGPMSGSVITGFS
jgi:hypothetical protein